MKVSKYKVKYVDGRKFYIAPQQQKLLDAKTNRDIKKKYKIHNNNRKYIIDALLKSIQGTHGKLLDATAFTIIKFDIEKFFESVNTHLLYKRINRSNILDSQSLNKIKEVVFSPSIKGLPQGVSFSSSLADLYLEDFDRNIPNILPNVLLYERFVDDVIVVLYGDHTPNRALIKDIIVKQLNKNNLKIKHSKTEISLIRKSTICKKSNRCQGCKNLMRCEINSVDFNFSYLGYQFSHDPINIDKLKISVHQNKIKKYIEKVRSLFTTYYHSTHTTKDFYVLFYSLKNLLWRVQTKKYDTNQTINFGFVYNYLRINNFEAYFNINNELKKQIKKCKHLSKLNRNELGTLYIFPTNRKRYYINFNKISRTRLLKMSNNLSINVTEDDPKAKIIKKIFNCLYK